MSIGGLVVLLFAFIEGYAHVPLTQTGSPPPHVPGNITPNPYPPGVPAIHPTHQVSSDTLAAFTIKDVEQFIVRNGFVGGPTISGKPPTIVKIVFVTSKEASNLMKGESVGRPGDALVCYVLLRGPFKVSTRMSTDMPVANPTATLGELVFDAQTGNLLVWGYPAGSLKISPTGCATR